MLTTFSFPGIRLSDSVALHSVFHEDNRALTVFYFHFVWSPQPGLYDRRDDDDVSLDEVERIGIMTRLLLTDIVTAIWSEPHIRVGPTQNVAMPFISGIWCF